MAVYSDVHVIPLVTLSALARKFRIKRFRGFKGDFIRKGDLYKINRVV